MTQPDSRFTALSVWQIRDRIREILINLPDPQREELWSLIIHLQHASFQAGKSKEPQMEINQLTLDAAAYFDISVENLTPAMRHRFKILRANGLEGKLHGGRDLGWWTVENPSAIVPDPLD